MTCEDFRVKQAIPLRDFDELPNAAVVDVRIVAALCGWNTGTVWRHVSEGNFPKPIKIGGSTRWRVSDLRSYLSGDVR